jgi:hypothetical protein
MTVHAIVMDRTEMSDDRVEIERSIPTEVSVNDFELFMREKGISDDCIVCKGQLAIMESSDGTVPVAVSVIYPPAISGLTTTYAFRTVCLNCGNLQIYNRDQVAEWKRERT